MSSVPPQSGWNPKPIPTVTPGHDNRKKVNVKVSDFDNLILKQGVRVRVFRSSYCPNVKSIDGAEHEIDCNLCHGTGFVDTFPLESWAFFQNQELEKRVFAEGLYDGNTVAATFLTGVGLQYFTLVELMDFSELFFERIKRQAGKLDVLKYPATRINFLVDKHGKQYYEGSDFQLDVNGNVLWQPNRGPQAGIIYTINYDTKVRFRAVKAAHVNRFAQVNVQGQTQLVKMNEQWLLQKEYLVVRKDMKLNVIEPNRINDSDTE